MATLADSPDAKSQGLSRKERRQLKEKAREQARADELTPILQELTADDGDVQLQAAHKLRAALGEGAQAAAAVDSAIRAGVLPRLVQLSRSPTSRELQFEVLWILADVSGASPEKASAVAGEGAMDVCVELLCSPAAATREQALTILANIAGASHEMCNAVAKVGAVASIQKLVRGTSGQPVSVMQGAARCLHCLCQGEPFPFLGEAAQPMIELLETLAMSSDEGVLTEACLSLACLQYKPADPAMQFLRIGVVCPRLVELLTHTSDEVKLAATRAAMKIVVGGRQGLDAVMRCRPIADLREMLRSENSKVSKASCSMLANILALGAPCVQEVVDEGCPQLLVALLRADDDEVKRAAARALGVLSSRCTPEQLQPLAQPEAVAPMVAMLELAGLQGLCEVARLALTFLESVLEAGRRLKSETFAELVRDADAARLLEAVPQMSNDRDLCARARAVRSALG